MAEAFLQELGGNRFHAESAGLEPGLLNPLVVKVMMEVGIDISAKQTHDVFDFFKEGRRYEYVVTVCNNEAAERCPIFPGVNKTIAWSFADPASFVGSTEEKLTQTREVRDAIRSSIVRFIADIPNDEHQT
jgi:arsenate reductase